jgi:hypothetical protein
MALDILDAAEKISGILLFSGDSDLHEPLERLKLKVRVSMFLAFVDRWQGSCGSLVPNTWISASGMRALKSENPSRETGTACIGKSLSSLHSKYAIKSGYCQGFLLKCTDFGRGGIKTS